MRPAPLSWFLVLAALAWLLSAAVVLYQRMTYERRMNATIRSVTAFADSVRVDLRSKQCVFLPFVPRDTIRNPRW